MVRVGTLVLSTIWMVSVGVGMPSKNQDSELKRVLRHLKERLVAYQNMLKDCKETFESNKDSFIRVDQTLQSLRNSTTGVQNLYAILEHVEKGDLHPVIGLRTMLGTRLENLEKRAKNIAMVKASTSGIQYEYGKTGPAFYDTLSPFEKMSADLAIDSYQDNHAIIKGLYDFLGLTTVRQDPVCYRLITLSPALWDLLEGKTQDLGHPDQGIVDENWNFFEGSDLRLFQQHGPAVLPLLRLPVGSSYPHGFNVNPPAFLNPPQPGPTPKKEASQPKKLDGAKKTPKSVDQVSSQGESSAEFLEDVSEQTKTPIEPEPLVSTEPSIIPKAPETAEKTPVQPTPVAKSKSKPQPKPREVVEEVPQRPSLRGNHLDTHQRIFATSYQCDVGFKDAKTLWEYLGGQILSRSTTGSHRVLQWQGKTIGFTYVPHGNSQIYGHRAIKDIRQAFEKIGWGKDTA